MKCAASSSRCAAHFTGFLAVLATIITAGIATGCGSGGSMSKTQTFSGNTQVTLLLTSTANDQLSEFDLALQTIQLTSQSGTTVSLLASPQPSEYIHVNGAIDVLTTLTVPQGIYTSATATIGYAAFTCMAVLPANSNSPGSLSFDIFAYSNTPNSNVTVNLPAPITIIGSSMGLLLDLQVAQSATFPSTCYSNGIPAYSITPTFNLSGLTFSSQPQNPAGSINSLEGKIVSLTSASGFTLVVPEGPGGSRTLSVNSSRATIYQGITNFSSLSSGMFVNIDAAVQPDGSLLAGRIAVEDSSALNVLTGPIVQVASLEPVLSMFGLLQQAPVPLGPSGSELYQGGAPYFNVGNSIFQISGQMTNLQKLPFVASFNASNMVPGQNVDITSPAFVNAAGVHTPANTVTLIPQTINATVTGSSPSGAFTDYTASLANYDLFPALAVQPGQTTRLNTPSQVEVYVDSSTQLLNLQNLAAGGTFRFYGLIFNDNGTLRMDCAQVNDGVPFAPQSSANTHLETGRARTIQRLNGGGLPELITTVTRSR
jgi:hypothetical protein